MWLWGAFSSGPHPHGDAIGLDVQHTRLRRSGCSIFSHWLSAPGPYVKVRRAETGWRLALLGSFEIDLADGAKVAARPVFEGRECIFVAASAVASWRSLSWREGGV